MNKTVKNRFAIQIGDHNLKFQTLEVSDSTLTVRELIEKAGYLPADDYLIFAVTENRRLNELNLNEKIDISLSNGNQLIIFNSDRSWRCLIDGIRFEWGAQDISVDVIKWLAGVDPIQFGVWLECKDELDIPIADDQLISLNPSGTERFRTAKQIKICIEGEMFPWDDDTITTEQIAQLGGWDVSIGVIEVDNDQNERTLKLGEMIKLKPGYSYGKKLYFKRGRLP